MKYHIDNVANCIDFFIVLPSDELVSVFPNVTLYPVLGNHDPYPENQMPYNVETTDYYRAILETSRWDAVLGSNESKQFHNGKYTFCQTYTEKD